MLLPNLVKKEKKKVLIAIITVLASILSISPIYAETISPFSTEETLGIGQSTRHSISYSNENEYSIFITPKVYKYYPQSEYILDAEGFEKFVIIDTDYIEIPANSKVEISFQIDAPEALEPGTYYNLIVFQPTQQNEKDDPIIGATGALSHIVKLHITDDVKGVQITDQYDTNLEILNRGIPFVKPAKIRFSFFNNSQYTLIPKGEIQVVKRSGDKEPEYFKINTSRDRVFPDESFEQEFEVSNWYIEDVLFGKTAYLKVQNGIDENIRSEEVTIPGFRNEFLYILATATVVVLLATSLKSDGEPEQEYAE
jgi:hypothetical protein